VEPATSRGSSSALKLKETGNMHFKRKEFSAALTCYEEALSLGNATQDVALALNNNMAACALEVGDLRKAKEGAEAAAAIDPRNLKAKYRLAVALSRLRHHPEAVASAEEAAKMDPGNADVKRFAAKARRRLRESVGELDYLTGLVGGSLLSNSPWEVGANKPEDPEDFIGPLEVRLVPGKGRGVFSKRAINKGETVLAEWAYAHHVESPRTDGVESVTIFNSDHSMDTLSHAQAEQKALARSTRSPLDAARLHALYGGDKFGTQAQHAPPMSFFYYNDEPPAELQVSVVSAAEVKAICDMNAFSIAVEGCTNDTDENQMKRGCGLWIMASLFNHDDRPNCSRFTSKDGLMIVTASEDISVGTELTLAYFNPGADNANERRKHYGIPELK